MRKRQRIEFIVNFIVGVLFRPQGEKEHTENEKYQISNN